MKIKTITKDAKLSHLIAGSNIVTSPAEINTIENQLEGCQNTCHNNRPTK